MDRYCIMNDTPQRPIRSFVRREGRITPSQQRALEKLWPQFGVDFVEGTRIDLEELFGAGVPVTLEIGFGMGVSLLEMARAEPGRGFLGIEVHRPGVGRLLAMLEREGVGNVRVLCEDAVNVLRHAIAPGSLDRVQIYFPDPWPKKRHHKRRLLQAPFVELVAACLRPGGILHVATDWENYAEQVLEVLDANEALANTVPGGGYAERPDWRPLTRFEQRGLDRGHGVWDLLYRRKS